ncbi:MAG: DegV family protein, partial [Erysipelotrichaceae bacterium]
EFPNKKVHVIDTHATAGHLILIMEKAIELFQQNLPFEEICQILDQYNEEREIIFTLGSYDNLVKTGRMSPLVNTVISTLNIKVICENSLEGEIIIKSKIRGLKKTLDKMIEKILAKENLANTIYINHCYNEENALYIKEQIQKALPNQEVKLLQCKGLTTFYSDNQGIIIAI